MWIRFEWKKIMRFIVRVMRFGISGGACKPVRRLNYSRPNTESNTPYTSSTRIRSINIDASVAWLVGWVPGWVPRWVPGWVGAWLGGLP
ncbi:hypothetical protein M0804_007327 [Polistes exclamans]|nr:hypothetical protein M0804_007327 [Polistes exclamans]